MKKIAVNNTRTTVILASGRLELAPKGTPGKKDRKEIDAELAAHPDVVRFADQMKISLLSMEDAGLKEHKETAKAPAAPVVPSPTPPVEEKPAAEDKLMTEEEPAATYSDFKPAELPSDELPPEDKLLPEPEEEKPEEVAPKGKKSSKKRRKK